MYRLLFSLVLSKLDAELAHTLAVWTIRAISWTGIGFLVRLATRPHPSLAVETLGLHFDSPFGLAAGFDKDAKALRGLWYLGFGHIEVGTLTARAQPGNGRPRLFRLIADRAVINRMGFNNNGSAEAIARLRRERSRRDRPIIGANIGKSRVVPIEDSIEDYLDSARSLAPVSDYLAVNVSSPNTPGLRGLQDTEKLAPLLKAIKEVAGTTPVLVKISPDLSDAEVLQISKLAVNLGLAGLIATNTTVSRSGLRSNQAMVSDIGDGGLSGPPLAARALSVLHLIRSVVPADLCVISVGGVETANDVLLRLRAGATLVQGYTAFLYRGPLWARQITTGILRLAE